MPDLLSRIWEKHSQLHTPALLMALLQACIRHDSTSALEALLQADSLAVSFPTPFQASAGQLDRLKADTLSILLTFDAVDYLARRQSWFMG